MEEAGVYLQRDSLDYEVLSRAVESVAGVEGIVCEIGTRRGGSAKTIVDALVGSGQAGRTLLCIDPWGDVPYTDGDGSVRHYDYTNQMRDETIGRLYQYVVGKPVNLVVLIMEDTEFMRRFADGVPIYQNRKKWIWTKYALVFFDGPHSEAAVREEMMFFLSHGRMANGGVFVFDDIGNYDHDSIENTLLSIGAELIEKTPRKASYRLR